MNASEQQKKKRYKAAISAKKTKDTYVEAYRNVQQLHLL
jgi:hypothetical protein